MKNKEKVREVLEDLYFKADRSKSRIRIELEHHQSAVPVIKD